MSYLEEQLAYIAGEFVADLSCLEPWVRDAALSLSRRGDAAAGVSLEDWEPGPDDQWSPTPGAFARSLTDDELRVFRTALVHMLEVDGPAAADRRSLVEELCGSLAVHLALRRLPWDESDVYNLARRATRGTVLVPTEDLQLIATRLTVLANRTFYPQALRIELASIGEQIRRLRDGKGFV